MYQKIYRLRLLVKESSRYFSIHLSSLKEKEPTFIELFRKVENLTKITNLDDYYLATTLNKTVLFDDRSLQTALKSSTSDKQTLEIMLCRKSLDDLHKRLTTKVVHLPTETVPVIKPTVLRWTPAILPTSNHVRRFSSSQDNDNIDTRNDIRKDSGISLNDEEEPHRQRKKQRVMSADHHPRKLPDPSSSPLPTLLLRNNSITTSLHPLEIRRPSTAPPPSCSPPSSPFPRSSHYIPPTLPTISHITSSNHSPLDSQLAPIQTSTATYHNKRSRSMSSSTSVSIFHCEHATDHGKVCGQTFRRSYDLSRHQTIHLENRPFCYCDKCGKKFTRMDALRRHERVQGHSSKHRSMSLVPKTSV